MIVCHTHHVYFKVQYKLAEMIQCANGLPFFLAVRLVQYQNVMSSNPGHHDTGRKMRILLNELTLKVLNF